MRQFQKFCAPLPMSLAVFLASGLGPCEAGLFAGPANYYECLLERLEGVQNDVVAASETSQCRSEFPDSTLPEKTDPGLFGPETVAECLSNFGASTPSSYAANLIREACFQLYPEKPASD